MDAILGASSMDGSPSKASLPSMTRAAVDEQLDASDALLGGANKRKQPIKSIASTSVGIPVKNSIKETRQISGKMDRTSWRSRAKFNPKQNHPQNSTDILNIFRPITESRNVCNYGKKVQVSNSKNIDSKIEVKQNKHVQNRGDIKKEMFSYRYLERLAESDFDAIINVIGNKNNNFEDFLKSIPRKDFVLLVMRLVSKVCCSGFVQNQTYILAMICTPEFICHLKNYLTDMLTETNAVRKKTFSEFFHCLYNFFERVFEIMPNTARDRLSNLLVVSEVTIHSIETTTGVQLDSILFDKLQKLKLRIEEIQKIVEKKSAKVELKSFELPPNDFREMIIYPTIDDLCKQNFVRPNIVVGSYKDVDHYLDIQFRLLREDFIDPLRCGIKCYIQSLNERKKIKNYNIKIYENVTIEPGIMINREKKSMKTHYTVNFKDNKFVKRIKWQNSKRLTYGSLLLFSDNNFQTFFLGTVEDRNIKELENGITKVILCEGNLDNMWKRKFVMAESSLYFEPYFQVLSCLQNMSVDSLPMQNYILVKDFDQDTPPAYLLNNSNGTIDNIKFDFLKDFDWPHPSKLSLDDSQYKAFKAALTREFVVIQGPPGTGKTFLGLKIAKTLLKNKLFGQSPILVVCYTNHALDQFLEGLLEYTNNVIRIGGQSKNEALNDYNLRKFKRFNRNSNFMKGSLIESIALVRSSAAEIRELIGTITSKKGIIKLEEFNSVITPQKREELQGEAYQYWLLDVHVGNLGMSSKKVNNDDNIEDDDEDTDDESTLRRLNSKYSDPFVDIKEIQTDIYSDKYEVSFEDLANKISELRQELTINIMDASPVQIYSHMSKKDKMETYERCYNALGAMMKYLQLISDSRAGMYEVLEKRPVWLLTLEERWALYGHWEKQLLATLHEELLTLNNNNDELVARLLEVNEMENIALIRERNVEVIGLTTTGAAKHRNLICAIKPKIVIVEEAAEVLEAHIAVALSYGCKHLILIGDHKQLRPNPATYKLAKEYSLDISLFERMLKNGMNTFCLEVQHRMRGEISALVTPSIYETLLDHESVLSYPHIKGVVGDLFFVDHCEMEQNEEDSESHINTHEADFLIALCRYLILQGYSSNDITILTTYSGQQFYMRQESKKMELLKGVRITVVDNYQGEESKIILLSLVRSNTEGKIGFLKTENRVCVALSRAKYGMYIIGNMTILKNSDIWKKMNDTFQSQCAIGSELMLECQVHKKLTKVQCANDFRKVSEGGCDALCNKLLNCGHNCKQLCHVVDREHSKYKCFEKCEREICPNFGHPCPQYCHKPCKECMQKVKRTLECGHENDYLCHIPLENLNCYTLVDITLELCGHKMVKKCWEHISAIVCTYPCDIRLKCGHSCTKKCHMTQDPDHLEYVCFKTCANKNKNCSENHLCQKRCCEECGECTVMITKKLPCEHISQLKCSEDITTVVCKKRCKRKLDCGHACKLLCCTPCGNCQEMVLKRIPECGHLIKIACQVDPSRTLCQSLCERFKSCGHKCKIACRLECSTAECNELVKSRVTPSCGHDGYVRCSDSMKDIKPFSDVLLKNCMKPCNAELPCGDKCSGTCGECMQGRIHTVCKSVCGNTLICGHACSDPCRETCPPCSEKCTYKCKHSRCNHLCGNPCKPCAEKCTWVCPHYKCTKMCGELCDRPPCDKPCTRTLKCNHPCIGFCGEPCPPLCRKCDAEELTELFFGTEDEPDARFVLLEDCGHVLESSGLDHWVSLSNVKNDKKEIGVISCPKCKTQIHNTMRFMNIVKSTILQIQMIKKKIFGQKMKMDEKRQFLNGKLLQLSVDACGCKKNIELEYNDKIINKLHGALLPTKQNLRGLSELSVVEFIMEYLSQLYHKILESNLNLKNYPNYYEIIKDRVDLLMEHLLNRGVKISNQEREQFNMELLRFIRIVDYFCMITSDSYKRANSTNCSVTDLSESIFAMCFSIQIFTSTTDQNCVSKLNQLKTLIRSTQVITEREKAMIHAAMSESFHSGYKQGHWYKCPNGHTYCITECGGAMMEARCPECKETIGGTGHALNRNNKVDSSMAGARYAAWSDIANERHNFLQ